MSAFVVSRQHIHQLVTAIDQYVAPTEEPTALGQMLWDENIASVLYRYPDDTKDTMPGPADETFVYEYVTPQRPLTPVEVYKIASCFAYQSCENPGWDGSQAKDLMGVLQGIIERQLGKSYEHITRLPEYDAADWEIRDDNPKQPAPIAEKKPVRHINLVDTAKLVRKALKAAYPGTKFSVRCDRYSMGCSIDVFWTDGPTEAQVQPLLNKFDSKSFDGMTGSTSYHTQEYEGETVSFGAYYVKASRSLSADFLRKIAAKVAAQYHVAVPEVKENGSHPFVPASPEGCVLVPDAPPFHRDERLLDVIHHVAQRTSALPKPRIRIMAEMREVA